jgi:POT family proton-dependent oligopeptide transporter
MLGALVSDGLLGKYRTIFWVSMIYCLGHLVLSVGGTAAGNVVGLTPRVALALGLGLIAIGAGGIKPCVSANVGDQFGPRNQHLLERVYSWFYFSINFGSSFSTMLIPWLLHNPSFGPSASASCARR